MPGKNKRRKRRPIGGYDDGGAVIKIHSNVDVNDHDDDDANSHYNGSGSDHFCGDLRQMQSQSQTRTQTHLSSSSILHNTSSSSPSPSNTSHSSTAPRRQSSVFVMLAAAAAAAAAIVTSTSLAIVTATTTTTATATRTSSHSTQQIWKHLRHIDIVQHPINLQRDGDGRKQTVGRKLQTTQQCQIALAIGDSDRNDVLAGDVEYPRFVNQLSGQQYSDATSVTDLPQPFQDSFAKFADTSIGGINVEGSKPGQTPTAEQEELLTALCTETIAILNGEEIEPAPPTDSAPAPAPEPSPTQSTPGGSSSDIDCSGTVSRSECNTALAIADLSRDDLLNEAEYVRFVNRLSGNAFDGSSYDDLPGNIKDNFIKFATTSNQVNIFGSKPGQTADSTQDEFLNGFCCETDIAVQDPSAPTEPAPPPPTSAPAPSSGPPAGGGGEDTDCEGTVARSQCDTAMSIADLNRDDLMNEDEYVRFVNRLSNNEYASSSFGGLPANIQATFGNYATTGGQVNIFGSKPGQTATAEQDELLDNFCCETDIAIQNPGQPAGGEPTLEPAPPPPSSDGSPPPTFADTFCRTAMASSDFNRDDQLNEEEYVRFLNRLTSNEFAGQEFSGLGQELQTNFVNLAGSDNQIDIFGSKPGQTATDEQEEFLDQICLDTAIALNSGGEGPTPEVPTSAPGTPTQAPDGPPSDIVTAPPTFLPGLSEVYNSFIISNTIGLAASDLQSGANREGLDSAYAEFAARSVRQIGGVTGSRNLLAGNSTDSSIAIPSSLRRRKLVVELVVGSTKIYLLEDSECPESAQAKITCQTAFAQFQVSITDEDPQVVSDEYTAASQVQIQNGLLQETLDEVDRLNALDIVNASFPVRAEVAPTEAPIAPTEVPALAPPSGGDEGDSGSGGAGGIVGGVIGGIVVIGLGVYVYFKGIPGPAFKFGGRGGNKTDDEDDGEGGFDKDDDASAGDKDDDDDEDAFGRNAFGSGNKNAFGGGDAGDEKAGHDAKNVFGFRKKDKDDGENKGFGFDEDYGLDSKGSAHNSFGDDNGGGKYEFDEPSELRDDDDDDDDERGSVNANDNPFGAASSSPGWGNTFGSGNEWGANNIEGNNSGQEQNFFGDSNFVDNGDEGDGSRSGSGSEYSSSEDSTYESEGADEDSKDPEDEDEYDDEEGSGSNSRSSAGSCNSGSTPDSRSLTSELKQKDEYMDAAIERGDWDAVAKSAGSFGKGQESIETSSRSGSDAENDNEYADEDGSGSYSGSSRSGSMSGSADEGSASSATTTSEDLERREEYRAQVDALVKLVLPDETDKVDAMMEQFKGREAELVSTLQTMQERSANQRARAAVHKSKTRPQRPEGSDGAYALANGGGSGGEGAAAGTAAIAAASLPIPADGMFGDEQDDFVEEDGGDDDFEEEDVFGEDPQYADDEETGSGPYSDEGSYSDGGSRSQYSGSRRESERSGSRSYYSGEDDSRSYSSRREEEGSFSGSGSRSRSQYSGSRRGSEKSGSGSHSRSSYSGSRRESERSGSGSRSRSQYSGSRRESERSGSRSHYSGEDGSRSHDSGADGSRSYYSGEGDFRPESQQSGSRSYYDDEGSRSPSHSRHSGSQSYYSKEDGDDGSRSYYSEEEDSRPESQTSGGQSYHEEDGSRSRSQRSGSQSDYSNEDGSRSYYSNEEDDDGSGEGGSFAGSQEGD